MIAFLENRKIFTWLCVYPADKERTTKWKKTAYYAVAASTFLVNVYSVITSAVYFYEYASADLAPALLAVVQISGCTNGLYIYTITWILRHEIVSVINCLQVIYDEYIHNDSVGFLKRANDQNRWICLFYFKQMIPVILLGHFLLAIISYLSCIWRYDEFDPEHVFHIFKAVLPWNQNTRWGYAIEVLTQLVCGMNYLISVSIIITYISLCLHHYAFSKMFEQSLNKLNRFHRARNDTETLNGLVKFHVDIKDFFGESSDVFSYFILVQLISAMIMVSGSLLHLDLQFHELDFTVLSISALFWSSFFILFLYCFFGKVASNSYEDMSVYLYNANWIELPLELQKYFIMLIANAQLPLYYHGFRIVVLNLETFTRFMRTVFSFYAIFKTLTE